MSVSLSIVGLHRAAVPVQGRAARTANDSRPTAIGERATVLAVGALNGAYVRAVDGGAWANVSNDCDHFVVLWLWPPWGPGLISQLS